MIPLPCLCVLTVWFCAQWWGVLAQNQAVNTHKQGRGIIKIPRAPKEAAAQVQHWRSEAIEIYRTATFLRWGRFEAIWEQQQYARRFSGTSAAGFTWYRPDIGLMLQINLCMHALCDTLKVHVNVHESNRP